MYRLSEEQLHDIHRNLLKLLMVFRDICDAEGIWYSLAFGTVLGAVRHNGFIPWDTDVDVYLKWPDVEQFRKAFMKHRPEGILLNDRHRNPRNTKSHDTLYYKNDMGFPDLHLDIYPLTGTPEDVEKRKTFRKKCEVLDKIFRSKYVNLSACQPKNKPIVAIVKVLDRLLPDRFIKSDIDRRERLYDLETSSCWFSLIGDVDPFDRHVFDKVITHKFENEEFLIPGDWDTYLKSCYGDYMTPRKY